MAHKFRCRQVTIRRPRKILPNRLTALANVDHVLVMIPLTADVGFVVLVAMVTSRTFCLLTSPAFFHVADVRFPRPPVHFGLGSFRFLFLLRLFVNAGENGVKRRIGRASTIGHGDKLIENRQNLGRRTRIGFGGLLGHRLLSFKYIRHLRGGAVCFIGRRGVRFVRGWAGLARWRNVGRRIRRTAGCGFRPNRGRNRSKPPSFRQRIHNR